MASILSLWTPVTTLVWASVASPPLAHELPGLIQGAELVIVGKVEGLTDEKPEARLHKEREAHRVLVSLTLQGYDENGRVLVINPRGLRLADGRSYIFMLRRLEGNFWEAQGGELLEGNTGNIDRVRQVVAKQGAAVLPARAVWMTHSAGGQKASMEEFFASRSGRFEWKKRLAAESGDATVYHTIKGVLPESAVQELIDKIQAAGAGPAVDDAGMVWFNWGNDRGEIMTKTYYAPTQSPCAELLETIARLARDNETSPKD